MQDPAMTGSHANPHQAVHQMRKETKGSPNRSRKSVLVMEYNAEDQTFGKRNQTSPSFQ